MAFPSVQAGDTKSGTVTSNSATWTLTYPTNLASGDLILAFAGIDGGGTTPTITGFNVYSNDNGNVECLVASRISDGTETGTFSMSLGRSEQGGWRVFRITGWFGSGLPASAITTPVDGNGLSLALSTGASTTPDPPSLDPANWATEDTLWFAACGVDTSRTISVFPLADNQSSDVSGGAGGATLGSCSTDSAVGSLDPGTFTISGSDDWTTYTVAVRPAAGGATVSDVPDLVIARRIPRRRNLNRW